MPGLRKEVQEMPVETIILSRYAKKYRGWEKKKQSVHSVEGIDDSDSETEDTEYLYSVSMTGMKNANKRDIHAEMMIKGQAEPTKFQVDCGATTNLISRSLVPEAEICPTNKTLYMWNQSKEKPLGECEITLINPKNRRHYKVTFLVIEKNHKPILGKTDIGKNGSYHH